MATRWYFEVPNGAASSGKDAWPGCYSTRSGVTRINNIPESTEFPWAKEVGLDTVNWCRLSHEASLIIGARLAPLLSVGTCDAM